MQDARRRVNFTFRNDIEFNCSIYAYLSYLELYLVLRVIDKVNRLQTATVLNSLFEESL